MPVQRAQRSSLGRSATAATLLLWVAAFTLVPGGAGTRLGAQAPAAAPRPVLAEAPLEQYRAYRRMHARNERFGHEAWLEAWTEFDGRAFRYDIVREHGSEYVLNKVLRKVLAREREIIADGGADRAELSPDNYDFLEPVSHGRNVRYVLLKPKRKDVVLVDGRMVLDRSGTELLRVEGLLAKNPSFWTSRVNVIRDFVRVNGARVPVSTESIAQVKFAGTSRLLVSYEYESVNGRPVSATARRAMRPAGLSGKGR